jgi:hypothetical protein
MYIQSVADYEVDGVKAIWYMKYKVDFHRFN